MAALMNAVIVVGTAMLLSIAGLLVVRRYVNVEWLKRHHEVAGYFFLMIGTLYAVLIAFAIYVVWSASEEAARNLQHEATEVADLSRLSTAMPDALRREITSALMEYLNAVVEDEFPDMQEGRDSERTWTAVQNLWDAYGTNQAATPRLQAYLAESLRHLTQLSDYRRIRLFASHGTVPVMLKGLLLWGAILLIALSYCVGHENVWSQAAMTAALAGVLSFSLFLIGSLDSPYSGVARVTPRPFSFELVHVASRMPK